VGVVLLLVGVALGATYFLRRFFVSEAFNVFVAVNTREDGAVDGVIELVGIDGEADGRAVGAGGGQSRIGVAGEAVGVFEFLRGKGMRADQQHKRGNRRDEDSPRVAHMMS
jgi:hypothetical protein